MNSLLPLPFFVFAYVARKPKSLDEGIKLPAVRRQLLLIKARADALGRTLGRRFMMTTTYRPKAFIDYSTFDEAAGFAQENGTALLVGDLAELLSGVPARQFRRCTERLDGLAVDVWDAATNRHWRDFNSATRNAIEGMALDRHHRGAAISVGRKKVQKPAGNITHNQLAGVMANKRRSARHAERIRPVVEAMKSALPIGAELSPSALMHRLNKLGIRGPQSNQWSLNATKRCLQILADRSTTVNG
jgi:hypothetical protein